MLKPRTVNKIVQDIYTDRNKILSSRKLQDGIEDYVFLKKEFDKSDILNNSEFQSVFCEFYGMNQARLTDQFKRRYFELLAGRKANLEYILKELYAIPSNKNQHKIQFSFATKLVHTIDNSKPIYDSNMINLLKDYGLSSEAEAFLKVKEKQPASKDERIRIRAFLELCDRLEKTYPKFLAQEKMRIVIGELYNKFQYSTVISKTKALDFIFWVFYPIKKAQSEMAK